MRVIKIPITKSLISLAQDLAPTEAINNRSITKGERNTLGVLGELCTIKVLLKAGIEAIDYSPTYDYDLLVNGVKIDVKTKQRTVAPRYDYDASIVAYSKDKQMCDEYIFTSITIDRETKGFKDFYIIGKMKKYDYFKNSTFMRKGDPDGNNTIFKNGRLQTFKIVEDCYNMKYGQLEELDMDYTKIPELVTRL